MNEWLRRLRGAIGMGLVWGTAWLGAGLVLLMIVGLGAADVPFPLFFGLLGFIAGVGFSGILGIAERSRRFDEMSLLRFAGWGAVGGLMLSVVMGLIAGVEVLPLLSGIFAAAGATCAAGSLALARMADDGDRLDSGTDIDSIGLTDEEERELLEGGG